MSVKPISTTHYTLNEGEKKRDKNDLQDLSFVIPAVIY